MHSESSVLSPSASFKPPINIELHICATCHRSFTGSRRNQLVQCARYVPCLQPPCMLGNIRATLSALYRPLEGFIRGLTAHGPCRCHEPTCTICSRTCNGCPPSVPPTPALTRTASPSSAPTTPLLSPRQPTSELDMDMTSAQDRGAPSTVAGRRRKVRDLDQEDEVAGYEGMDGAGEVLPGCGRTVCQKCAFETPERYADAEYMRGGFHLC